MEALRQSPAAQYDPPAGLTPAHARLLMAGGYDNRVFASALSSLFAKGAARLVRGEDGALALIRKRQIWGLGPAEMALVEAMRGNKPLRLDGTSYVYMRQLRRAHHDALMKLVLPSLWQRAMSWVLGDEDAFAPIFEKHRGAVEGYRTFLDVAMAARVDPRFVPDGGLQGFPEEMPWLVAFDLRNSWADGFTQVVETCVDGSVHDTSLSGLFDAHQARDTGADPATELEGWWHRIEEEKRQAANPPGVLGYGKKRRPEDDIDPFDPFEEWERW